MAENYGTVWPATRHIPLNGAEMINPRICALADKAIEDMPGSWHIPDKFCEKFAQLIVTEVFDCIADEGFEIYDPVIQKVKEHFGVE
jgi:hypothetical protein